MNETRTQEAIAAEFRRKVRDKLYVMLNTRHEPAGAASRMLQQCEDFIMEQFDDVLTLRSGAPTPPQEHRDGYAILLDQPAVPALAPTPSAEPPYNLRVRAEALWEELGGDVCSCQQPDVPHWCEKCQQNIDLIATAFRRAGASAPAAKPDYRPVPGHCFNIDGETWHNEGEVCTRCGFGVTAPAAKPDEPPPVKNGPLTQLVEGQPFKLDDAGSSPRTAHHATVSTSGSATAAPSGYPAWMAAAPAEPPQQDVQTLRTAVEALPRFAVEADRRGRMIQFEAGEFLYRDHVLALVASRPPQQDGPLRRDSAELIVALRVRAGYLSGREWEAPATAAMMREAADMIEALASRPPQGEPSGWQPIATAPKGGGASRTDDPSWVEPPRILASSPTLGLMVTYWDWYYADNGNGYINGRTAWVSPDGDGGLWEHNAPTHWMPLPSPPQAPEKENAK